MKKLLVALNRVGPLNFIKLAMIRVMANLFALPIALIIISISPFIRIRLIRLFSFRIGHYAVNTELILCAKDLNIFNEKKKIINLYYTPPNEPICNMQLHRMWKRVIRILPFSLISSQVDKFLVRILGDKYQNDVFKKTFESTSGFADRWGLLFKIKKCHLSFTESEMRKGQALLEKLGIPKNTRYICLLARDSNYLKIHLPNADWSYHDYRDVDINTYEKAAKYLVNKGYYVLRMGKYVSAKFETGDRRIIDYANHPMRSDFLDIYLTANCDFMMSSSCGLDSIAYIFRKPVLVTNIPLSDVASYNYYNLFIPKKFFELHTGKMLSIKKALRDLRNVSPKNLLNTLNQKGWRIIDNTSDEILDAVIEMLAIIEDQSHESNALCPLQEQFWKCYFAEKLPASIEGFRNEKMRIGASFLKNNPSLLTEIVG